MLSLIFIPIIILLFIFLHHHHQKQRRYSYLNFEQFKQKCIDTHSSHENETISFDRHDQHHHVESPRDFLSVHNYIQEFLCRPNENLNRPGPVCPFVPTSLKQRSIYFLIPPCDALKDEANLIRLVRICRDDFLHHLEPKIASKEKLVYKCLIIVLQTSNLSHENIEHIQVLLKPEFIAQHGLMLGEFHRSSNASSVRNGHFYPLRTEIPLLVMRYIVAEDLCFLNQRHRYSDDICRKMIEKYILLYHTGLLYRANANHLLRANEILKELKLTVE